MSRIVASYISFATFHEELKYLKGSKANEGIHEQFCNMTNRKGLRLGEG